MILYDTVFILGDNVVHADSAESIAFHTALTTDDSCAIRAEPICIRSYSKDVCLCVLSAVTRTLLCSDGPPRLLEHPFTTKLALCRQNERFVCNSVDCAALVLRYCYSVVVLTLLKDCGYRSEVSVTNIFHCLRLVLFHVHPRAHQASSGYATECFLCSAPSPL